MAENISLRNYSTFSINYFACSNNYLKCVKIKIIFSNTVFLNQTNSLHVLLLRLTWCRNNRCTNISIGLYRTTKKRKRVCKFFVACIFFTDACWFSFYSIFNGNFFHVRVQIFLLRASIRWTAPPFTTYGRNAIKNRSLIFLQLGPIFSLNSYFLP